MCHKAAPLIEQFPIEWRGTEWWKPGRIGGGRDTGGERGEAGFPKWRELEENEKNFAILRKISQLEQRGGKRE